MSKASNAAKCRRAQRAKHEARLRKKLRRAYGRRPLWSRTLNRDDHQRWWNEGQRNLLLEEISRSVEK